MTKFQLKHFVTLALLFLCFSCADKSGDALREGFVSPPDSCRPGVYWYFMDGNLSKEGMTADLESMKQVGIGYVLFLEVDAGVPRGKVDFLSDEWQDLFAHAVAETERLGMELAMGSGPGWTGSGGPWVEGKQSMRHLVASDTTVTGPVQFSGKLSVPAAKTPYFGEEPKDSPFYLKWLEYYEDVFVFAFPTPENDERIADVGEKALYYRDPYSSMPGVKPYLPTFTNYGDVQGIDQSKIIDLTANLSADGTLQWEVPAGKWTIMRMGARSNGAVTRPAPMPGLGFEVDKFDTLNYNTHFDEYMMTLINKTGGRKPGANSGWTMIHMDSWEMGTQNWSNNFKNEFAARRHYDPTNYFPTYTGRVVGDLETSERFLWDVRQTGMELVLENHARHFKNRGKKYGLDLSIQPYDINPTADLDLGAVADVPACEFWARDVGFSTAFSCLESTSIAHVHNKPVVQAEAFTAVYLEAWKKYPENVKNQGDWAFCTGINKFIYHTFAHKSLDESLRPGMTMGPYGVHWDRGQTWWTMSADYHKYISRCQFVLRQGRYVADILYLTPEGAPQVFRPPYSALSGDSITPDKRGYSFDGCSPLALIEKADVKDNRVVFPGGASYRVMVLPFIQTMTPELARKIEKLVSKGATVVGIPPLKSPSLTNYPDCDKEVEALSLKMWQTLSAPSAETVIKYGRGTIHTGGKYTEPEQNELYPHYDVVAEILDNLGMKEDFASATGQVRYTHREMPGRDIYFVSNATEQPLEDICVFRSVKGAPEVWDPVTGEMRKLKNFTTQNSTTSIPMAFDKSQSFFIIFDRANRHKPEAVANFPEVAEVQTLAGSWSVAFDPKWGGPEQIVFERLTDWSKNADEGIRFYSGIATYSYTFDYSGAGSDNLYIDLGDVKNIARVRLNGADLGVAWTSPWRVKITEPLLQQGNSLEIEVANLWANRFIGDSKYPDDGPKDGKWPEWLLNGDPRPGKRYTFSTYSYWEYEQGVHPLLPSGLLGPVRVVKVN